MGAMFKRAILGLLRAALYAVGMLAMFIVAALLAFVPLTALPGELHTDFVNGRWLKGGYILFVAAAMGWRVKPDPGRLSEGALKDFLHFSWRFISTFVAVFWLVGGLTWINAYGVQAKRTHDMVVTGIDIQTSKGGTETKTYKLREPETGWRSDLEFTRERDRFVRVGSCLRVDVAKGRLGLNWISRAEPMPCPSSAPA